MLPDTYTVRARILPAVIASIPLGATIFALAFSFGATWGLIISLFFAIITAVSLASIVRDKGIKTQELLYGEWGGEPTTKALRYRDANNEIDLKRLHNKLQKIFDVTFPSKEEELSDPENADKTYESCIGSLRERVRYNPKEQVRHSYYLVFEENCNYGFRRNSFGLKPIGLTISSIGIFCLLIAIIFTSTNIYHFHLGLTIASICFNVLSLVMWLFIVKANWVKVTAFAYARQLLATVNIIDNNELNSSNEKKNKPNWFVISVWAAVAGMVLTAVFLLVPMNVYTISLVSVGIVVFIVVIVHNPIQRYYRLSVFVLGSWLAISAIPPIRATIIINKKSLANLIIQDPGASFHVSVCFVAITLLILDFLLRRTEI